MVTLTAGRRSRGAGGNILILPLSYDSYACSGAAIPDWWHQESDLGQTVLLDGHCSQNPAADDGDEIIYKVALDVGEYTIHVIHHKENNRGKVKVTLNGTQILAYDGYAAELSINQEDSDTFTVTEAGVKDLKLYIDGKNGSSSAYYFAHSLITIYKMD